MYPIEIVHEEGDRFLVRARQHRFLVDQPADTGGTDHGPTPTELLVAGVGACVGFFAERYLSRHALPADGLRIGCRYRMAAERPSRVEEIDVDVELGRSLPQRYEVPFRRVIEGCTLHNTLRDSVRITIRVRTAAADNLLVGMGPRESGPPR